MVIATKYTSGFDEKSHIRANTQGNHLKSLHLAVKKSLERLQTDYSMFCPSLGYGQF
jgi:aryl-alcohol dehydrogenase-like predicted oxidoreductase